jgi:hypothetical protein
MALNYIHRDPCYGTTVLWSAVYSDPQNFNTCSSSSSREPNLERSLSSACVADSELLLAHMSPVPGEAILHNMFLSQRVTGIQASVFHASDKLLCKLGCLLHGLDINSNMKVRDVKFAFCTTL